MRHGQRPSGTWIEIFLDVPAEFADVAADHLITVTGRGVVLDETPGPEDRSVRILAYVAPSERDDALGQIRAFLGTIAGLYPEGPKVRLGDREIPAEDWAETWKASFGPVRIGRHLLVRPSWVPAAGSPGDIVMEIDPGQAFGTGTHATTAMVLEAMEDLAAVRPLGRVLDIGTGTGILAIAAARLGAGMVMAIDNDPEALAAARENTINNGVAGVVTCADPDMDATDGPFDLILANLDRDTLLALAPAIGKNLAPGGTLILSGILEEQEKAVLRAFPLHPRARRTRDDGTCAWSALTLTRQEDDRPAFSRGV